MEYTTHCFIYLMVRASKIGEWAIFWPISNSLEAEFIVGDYDFDFSSDHL